MYKATLRSNGKAVAVKVQRPGVLETVSLDLYLARELGYQLRKVRDDGIDCIRLVFISQSGGTMLTIDRSDVHDPLEPGSRYLGNMFTISMNKVHAS